MMIVYASNGLTGGMSGMSVSAIVPLGRWWAINLTAYRGRWKSETGYARLSINHA